MTNLDYTNFLTPTGQWSGSASAAPTHYAQYKLLFESLSGVQRPNGTITFDSFPANLRIVSGSGLNLPFNRVYVDIDNYDDYILLDLDLDGNYAGSTIGAATPSDISASYTSGGFWLMGNAEGSAPGILLMASGSAPTSQFDILNLNWVPLSSDQFTFQSGILDLDSNFRVICSSITTSISNPSLNVIRFNKNVHSWQKKILQLEEFGGLQYLTTGNIIVRGRDSNNVEKTHTFIYDDLINQQSMVVWWSGNTLTGQLIPLNSEDYIDSPSPFSSSPIPEFPSPSYVSATVYPDEPMISYSVIGEDTIQITSDINSIIPPLRKLYLNFSGIS